MMALVLMLMASYLAMAQQISLSPGTISTVAGTGTSGDTNNGGSATAAEISSPYSVRFDSSGNFYIAESGSYVREVVGGVGGTIKVFAGTGTAGFTGDNGPATSAEINTPRGLWIDANNNAYISDSGNNRIRVVYKTGTATACLIIIENPTLFGLSAGATSCTGATSQPVAGNIYTIAGGTGTGATGTLATGQALSSPRGVYVDASGDVYIADITNNKVRVVYAGGTAVSSLITLENAGTTPVVGDMYIVAGGGTATTDGSLATATSLNEPIDMNFDASGNLYVVLYGSSKVIQVSKTTGKVLTVAGTGTAGFAGDGGAATGAQFSSPRGIWLDAGGGIYIADASNNRIRKFTVGGTISTIAGTGTAAYNSDGVNATSANISAPYEIALDTAGNFYIADSGNYRIREVSILADKLAFGNVALGTSSTGQIVTLSNISASSLTLSGINISAQFAQIASGGTDCTGTSVLAPGASCNLDITCSPTSAVALTGTAAVSSNGGSSSTALSCTGVVGTTTTTLASTPSTATIPQGSSITYNVAVTSSAGTPYGTVNLYDNGSSTPLATITLSSGAGSYSTALLPAGNNCIVATYQATSGFSTSSSTPSLCVNVISNATATTTTLTANSTSTALGGTVTFTAVVNSSYSSGATGYVTFFNNGVALAPNAILSASSPYTATLSLTSLPLGVNTITAFYNGDANNLTSSSSAMQVTVYVQQAMLVPGIITTSIGNGTSGFAGNGGPATSATIEAPYVARSDSAGNLYVSDAYSEVRKVTASTGIISLVTGGSGSTCSATATCGDGGPATSATINNARGMWIDASGDIYLSDTGSNRVRVIYQGGAAAASIIALENSGTVPVIGDIYTVAGGGTAATGLASKQPLNSPRGVIVDSFGNLYIADIGTNHVRVVYVAGNSVAALITQENPTVLTPLPGYMYSIAGTGTLAESGNGGLASAASINEPSDIALDSSGNLYFVDYGGDTVRMVSASTGIISTLAGTTAGAGFSGDGGLATAAQLSSPRGIWVDDGSNIYIADTNNYRVRKITAATGVISTIAGQGTTSTSLGDGGAATSAYLNLPFSVALDPSGNLVLADNSEYRVRSVNAANSVLSLPNTFIGSSSTPGTIVLSNIGGDAITPSAFSITTGFTQATGAPGDCAANTAVASGRSCNIRISFTPVASGPANGTFTVTTNATNTSSGVFTAQLSGLGAYPNTVSSATTLAAIASADLGQTVTMTATVVSTGGGTTIPTGTVYFYRAGTIQIGTGTLNGVGQATLSISTLPLGTSNITALYLGDTKYQPSLSASQSVTIYNGPGDFSIAAPNTTCGSTVTVVHGQSANYCLAVTSTGGFDQTITFSCTNLPPNASCFFSPTLLTPVIGSTPTYFGLSIATETAVNQNGPHTQLHDAPHLWAIDSVPLLALLLWLPGLYRRRKLRHRSLCAVLVCLATLGTLNGCGTGNNAPATTPPGTYSITINAVAATSTHTFPVTMIVQ